MSFRVSEKFGKQKFTVFIFISETVLVVPAVQQQRVQDENIEEIRQSREIRSPDPPIYMKIEDSSMLLEQQRENDGEQGLMAKRLYQNTTNRVRSTDHHKRPSKWGSINCRTILWYVTFVGFMVNYMYRVNINIAIVDMVAVKKATTSNEHTSECVAHQTTHSPVNMTARIEVNACALVYFNCVCSSFYVTRAHLVFDSQTKSKDRFNRSQNDVCLE